jgi:hypothetical protein
LDSDDDLGSSDGSDDSDSKGGWFHLGWPWLSSSSSSSGSGSDSGSDSDTTSSGDQTSSDDDDTAILAEPYDYDYDVVKAYGIKETIIAAATNSAVAVDFLQKKRLEDEPGN